MLHASAQRADLSSELSTSKKTASLPPPSSVALGSRAAHQGVGVQEASRRQQNQAVQAVRSARSSAHNHVDQQGGAAQAVSHSSQPARQQCQLVCCTAISLELMLSHPYAVAEMQVQYV